MNRITKIFHPDQLVPCNNPFINEIIKTSKRNIPRDTFQPILRDGYKYCAWCAVNAIKPPNRKYCSIECQESTMLFCYPQTDDGLRLLLNRQNFKCNLCQYDYGIKIKNEYDKKINFLIEKMHEYQNNIKRYNIYENEYNLILNNPNYFAHLSRLEPYPKNVEIDHINPVALGGLTLGYNNLQAICCECHKIKTAKDMGDISNGKQSLLNPKTENQKIYNKNFIENKKQSDDWDGLFKEIHKSLNNKD